MHDLKKIDYHYYLLKGFQKSRNCLKWRYCYLLYNYQSVNEWCTCVCMSLYQYVKVSNWRNMSMNRTYSTSYLMAKIDNLCLLILTFMTNSMTVKYTTWVNTISFFNTCNYMILDFAKLRCLVLLSAQFLNCSTYMPRIFSKSEYQRFPIFF